MNAKGDRELADNCRTVWLTVERDLNARLHSPELLKHALQCSGRNPSEKTINHYWSKYGGSISFDQFVQIMQKEKCTTMADLLKAFRKIDLNGDGFISHDELFKVLTKRGEKLTHEEVQAIIDDADYNKDGKLDYAEFCHILLSTAAECQAAVSKRKMTRALNRPSHHADEHCTTVVKENRKITKMTPSTSKHDDRIHHRNNSLPVDKKIISSKQASLVENTEDTIDVTTLETRQSLSSKAKQQKHGGGLPLRDSSSDKETQMVNAKSSTIKENVTSVINSSEVVKHNSLSLEDDKSKKEVQNGAKKEVHNGFKKKPVESDSDSDKEVEEDLDESSNMGDSILQRLPISSTPAPVVHGNNSQTELTAEMEKSSQLFASKLPAINKATLPPLSLPQAVTAPPVTKATIPASNDSTTSTVTTPVISVATANVTTTTTLTTSTTNTATIPDKTGLEAKPLSDKDVKPVGVVADGGLAKNEEEDVEHGDEKESSHSRLVTVTPLSHSLSSELSGTLSDDSIAVTPTESIDVSDSGSVNKTVEELLANKQPDHLKQQQQQQQQQDTPSKQLTDRTKKPPPSSAVYQKPPKVPSNLESWYTISGKGCFYIKEIKESHISDEQDYNIVCQQYGLSLSQSTCVFVELQVVEPGNELCDVAMFIFKSDSTAETPTDFITFTEHQLDKRFVCKLDLDAGNYILVPFTTGCHVKPRDDDSESHDPTSLLTPDSSKLTPDCVKAITEIFYRIDLDDNGFISRQEFDLFQEHTSGEMCDDDAWQVIQDNFDQNSDDEITLEGFLNLHLMTAQDTSGGKETELMNILQAMGYSSGLILDEACPFSFNVHTETCEGEIVVMEMQPFASLINPVICQLAIMRGVAAPVKGEETSEEVTLYTYNSLYHTSTVIENKKEKKISVQLDCSDSLNFLYNRESCVQVLEIPPNSSVLGFHLMPNNPKDEWKPVCHAELILTQ